MDTEGPISVLDRRHRSSSRDRVVTDRITRRKSPGPRVERAGSRSSLNSAGGSSLLTADGGDLDDPEVVYRIAQPYRTSFSARHSVSWGSKPDRSRSLSPTSIRSETSLGCRSLHSAMGGDYYYGCRRPRGRSKSPKRVTYDTRVTVRHSDTEDSMFTDLSIKDYPDEDADGRPSTNPFSRSVISPRYNEFSALHDAPNQPSPSSPTPPPLSSTLPKHQPHNTNTTRPMKVRYRDHRTMVRDLNLQVKRSSDSTIDTSTTASRDSGLDYSSRIKDLSNEIVRMDWSPRQARSRTAGRPPPLSSPTHVRHHHHYQQQQQQQQHHRRSSSSASSTNSPSGGILKDSQNSRVGAPRGAMNDGSVSGNRSSGGYSGGSSSISPSPQHRPNPFRGPQLGTDGGKENDLRHSPTRQQQQQQQQHFHLPHYNNNNNNNHHQQQLAQQPHPDLDQSDLSSEYDIMGSRDCGYGPEEAHREFEGGKAGAVKDPGRSRPHHQHSTEVSPGGSTGETSPERGSPIESGRLTPSKRSFSLSISSFLKRFSPHLRRKKHGRDKGSKSSSAAGSAQSLTVGNGAGGTGTGTTSDGSEPGSSDSDGKHKRKSAAAKDAENGAGKGSHFSRSKVRQSLMKLVGRKSGSKSKKRVGSKSKGGKKDATADPAMQIPSHYTIELQDPDRSLSSDEVDEIINTLVINTDNNQLGHTNGKPGFPHTTSRKMKAIEDHNSAEPDLYKKFKERNSPKTNNTTNNLHSSAPLSTNSSNGGTLLLSGQPDVIPKTFTAGSIKADGRSDNSFNQYDNNHHQFHNRSYDPNEISMEFFTESDLNAILNPHSVKQRGGDFENDGREGDNRDINAARVNNSRVVPPSSLDVVATRGGKRMLQTSVLSNISGDESIGECSLDANLTASEPSLLNGPGITNGSSQSTNPSARYVHLPSSLVNSTITASGGHPAPDGGSPPDAIVQVQLRRHTRNSKDSSLSGSDSGPPSPSDPAHKPSYLKLACAVSGYGKYCRYSTYRDLDKPSSPFSSQRSLRSGGTSPVLDMPAEKNSSDEFSPKHTSSSPSTLHGTPVTLQDWRMSASNGVDTAAAVNGHNGVTYPTGDVTKDGEYYLQHAAFEEDRLRGLATRVEAVMRSEDLPEEACGRIRSAIGKANLLVSQKFVQFRELCAAHMQPDPEERETKWEDLQGFWDMIKLQVDNLDDMFAEIELMRINGWQEIPRLVPSRRSSASSSPKSANVSQASTPSATPAHTPGTKRKNLIANSKNTPDSSPERTQKARHAAKVRDDARRKLLADKRAAMKQQQISNGASSNSEVEIFLPESDKK